MNLEQAKQYPSVQAKTGVSVAVYKKSDYQSNGTVVLSTKLGTYKTGEKIGIVQAVYPMKSGKHLALIQLAKPIVTWFIGYSHVLAFIDDLESVGETGVMPGNTFYCVGNDVNVRKLPSLAGAKLPTKLNKGDIIGMSDGVVTNGYLKFNLRIGGIGYVSKTYCTQQIPIKTVTKTIVSLNPQTGVQTQETVPIITQPDSKIDYQRVVIGSVLGVVVGWIFTKIVSYIWK